MNICFQSPYNASSRGERDNQTIEGNHDKTSRETKPRQDINGNRRLFQNALGELQKGNPQAEYRLETHESQSKPSSANTGKRGPSESQKFGNSNSVNKRLKERFNRGHESTDEARSSYKEPLRVPSKRGHESTNEVQPSSGKERLGARFESGRKSTDEAQGRLLALSARLGDRFNRVGEITNEASSSKPPSSSRSNNTNGHRVTLRSERPQQLLDDTYRDSLHEQADDLSEIVSLASVCDHIKATHEITYIFLQDEEMSGLFAAGLSRVGNNKLEKTYTRLLRLFVKELRKEARTPFEQQVGRLMEFWARFISPTMLWVIDPSAGEMDRAEMMRILLGQREEREVVLERFLQAQGNEVSSTEGGLTGLVKAMPAATDSDEGTSDGSEVNDGPDLRRLEQLREFIVSSKAFAMLRTRLKNFVPSNAEVPAAMAAMAAASDTPVIEQVPSDPPYIQSLLTTIIHYFRPRVAEGYQRITWKCVRPAFPALSSNRR